MRLIRSAVKAGIVTKLFQEARKPHNQAKLRRAWQQVTGKAKAGSRR